MLLIVCYLSFYCIVAVATGSVIYVEPTNNGSCNESIFDNSAIVSNQSLQSLLANVTSNSVLKLLPGCHHLDRYVPILDKTNVTIEGVGESPDNVTINCDRNPVGMTFVNTSQLNVRMLTLQDCGLSGVNLNDTINHIKDNYLNSFESIFKLSLNNEIGLFIVVSSDVTLDTIVVKGVHGFGLLAVNVINSFQIESSTFAYNYNETCFSSSKYGLSGGASIIFQDNDVNTEKLDNNYILNIENTTFLHNSNCALDSQLEPYSSRISLALTTNDSYSYGGGGGLTVYLANHNYSVSVNVTGCLFKNNTATNGGGMFLGTFVGTDENTVTIKGSMFFRNGFQFGTLSDPLHRTFGQGLFILKDIRYPSDNVVAIPFGLNIFKITNCTFQENVATVTAGVVVLSRYLSAFKLFYSDIFTFDNCIFAKNKAYATSSMYLTEAKQIGDQRGIRITLTDMVFEENIISTTHFSLSSQSVARINTVEAVSVNVTLNGNNHFKSNTGTAFNLQYSILEVNGYLHFVNNSGNAGGGLALISSFVVLHSNSHVFFINNRAFVQAGAIYYSTSDPLVNYNCFLYFNQIQLTHCDNSTPCTDPKDSNITMTFTKNTAAISNDVYGSTLSSCPWVSFINSTNNFTKTATDPYRMLKEIDVFYFTDGLNADSLSTPTARFTTEVKTNMTSMPGQEIPVQVLAYDGFDQLIPDFISSTVFDSEVNGLHDSRLGNVSYWFTQRNRLPNVPVSIRSKVPIENDTQVEVAVYSIQSVVGKVFNVTVRKCYEGFEFPNHSQATYKTCMCTEGVQRFAGVNCFEENATIVVPKLYWLGRNNETNNAWVFSKCLFNYCSIGDSIIQNGEFDVQCRDGYNRSGILCGECQTDYSIKIGTNKCGKCSNFGLFWLLYFSLAGIFMVGIVLGQFGVTVYRGYINSFLFFANIIAPLIHVVLQDSKFAFLFIPINVLSGRPGLPICLFNGMTALHRGYFQFLYPTYLYILFSLYVVIGRCCNYKFRKWAPYSSRVFGTLVLLTYSTLLDACINGLHSTHIPTENDNVLNTRWAVDPNVRYFGSQHVTLGLISLLVLILYLIPLTVLLAFPCIAYRTVVGRKFYKIYDSFWEPFKDTFRFWVGFRLTLRLIPLLVTGFASPDLVVFLFGIFIVIYVFVQAIAKPFKKEAQNILEIHLSVCMLLLVVGALAQKKFDKLSPISRFLTAYFIIVICLVYIAIILVVAYHVFIKFKCLQNAVAYAKLKLQARFKLGKNGIEETVLLRSDIADGIEVKKPKGDNENHVVHVTELWGK